MQPLPTLSAPSNDPHLPVVHAKDGRVYANSRDVAAFFGKRHADVLRAVDSLECSESFRQRNFASADYIDRQGKPRNSVDMTRDGFTFLVMGFTGRDAARFKEAYIAAFNAMEERLRNSVPALPDFTDPAAAAEAWAKEYRGKVAAQADAKRFQNQRDLALIGEEMEKERADGLKEIIDKHEHSLTHFARTLQGSGRGAFGKWCDEQGFAFSKVWRSKLMKLAANWPEIKEAVEALPEEKRKWSVEGALKIWGAAKKAEKLSHLTSQDGEGSPETPRKKKETEAEKLRKDLAAALERITALEGELETLRKKPPVGLGTTYVGRDIPAI